MAHYTYSRWLRYFEILSLVLLWPVVAMMIWRSYHSAAALPGGWAVEIEAIFELQDKFFHPQIN